MTARQRAVTSFLGLSLTWNAGAAPQHTAQEIVRLSIAASKNDWQAQPNYSYFERDTDPSTGDSKTYLVTMIFGSPYQQLVAVNGKDLSKDQLQDEQKKLRETTDTRSKESKSERASRVSGYESDRERDHRMMEEMADAFTFILRGTGKLSGHPVYIIDAEPRQGYQPPDAHAKVLTGMKGTLWIDRSTFQWVKAEAHVIHPVSIGGFLADVQPGTSFELEKMPVSQSVWLPKHFQMKSDVKILGVFPKQDADDETFFRYQKEKKADTQ